MVTRPDRTSVGSRGATWTSLLEDWGITTDGKSQRNIQRRRRSRSNDIAAEMSGGAADEMVEAPPPPLEVGRPAAGCRGCPMPNCRFTVEEGAPWIPWEWRAPPAGEGSDRHAVAVSGVVERLQQRISKACFSGQIGRRTKLVFSWPVEGKRKIWGLNQRMHALVRRGPPESKPIPIL